MKSFDELEKAGRQAWLATLGTYAKGWDVISTKLNKTIEDSNQLFSELVSNGEKVEAKIIAEVKEKTDFDQAFAKLRKQLGVNISREEKIALLTEKVEQLTAEVEKLAEARATKLVANSLVADKPKTTTKARVTKKTATTKTSTSKVSAATKAETKPSK